MAFKINISEKNGKTFHLEAEGEEINGKILHEKIDGKEISPDLEGYEFEITGASDKAGFTAMKDVEGSGLTKVLLSYEKAMKKKPKKEGKKEYWNKKPKGLRLRKTVRGKIISPAIIQINLKVIKEGKKKLEEVFPDQCKSKVEEILTEAKPVEQAPTEEPKQETPKTKEKPEEKAPEKKEPKEETPKAE